MQYFTEDLFRFSGRMTRTRFMLYYGFFLVAGFFLLQFLLAAIGLVGGILSTILALLFFVGGIAVFVGLFAIHVRRLHDMDYPGWFALFPIFYFSSILFMTYLGFIIPGGMGTDQNYASLLAIVLMIPLGLFTSWVSLFPGTSGENNFGEDPRERSPDSRNLYQVFFQEFFSFSGMIGRVFFLKGILAWVFLMEIFWRRGIQLFFSGTGSFWMNISVLFTESPFLFFINMMVSLVVILLFLASVTSLLMRRIADLSLPRWGIVTLLPIVIIYFTPQFSQYFMLVWWLYIFLFSWKEGKQAKGS